jgi:hypothetical protein
VNGLLNQSRVGTLPVGLRRNHVRGNWSICCAACLSCQPPVSVAVIRGLIRRFTRVVADDPQQIAAAVKDLINQKLCPHMIRAETMSRMAEHRQRLMDLGQQIYAAQKTGRDFARDFYAVFTNKLGGWCHAAAVNVSPPDCATLTRNDTSRPMRMHCPHRRLADC